MCFGFAVQEFPDFRSFQVCRAYRGRRGLSFESLLFWIVKFLWLLSLWLEFRICDSGMVGLRHGCIGVLGGYPFLGCVRLSGCLGFACVRLGFRVCTVQGLGGWGVREFRVCCYWL